MAESQIAKETKEKSEPVFAGITLTNPHRVFYPELSLTKLDLARYYEAVAPAMLPYVIDRPISLVRCPEGYTNECFFQRHGRRGMSKSIKEVHIPGGKSKKRYLYIDGEAGLFGLVQIGEFTIGACRSGRSTSRTASSSTSIRTRGSSSRSLKP